MKNIQKVICTLAAVGTLTTGQLQAQDSTRVKMHREKKQYDAELPAWCIDLNLKGGMLMQDMTMTNWAANYTNSISSRTSLGNMKFDNGMSYGFDAQIGYFFGKKRHFGIGAGFMYLAQSGDLSLDKFHMEYQSTDFNNDVYRQMITSNGTVKEKLTITNMNIPVVLKYKNQFSKKWGFALDAGILYNLQLKNSYSTTGNFDYEAIYSYNKVGGNYVAYYDAGDVPGSTAWIITKKAYTDKNPTGNIPDTFNVLRSQGYNVGLGVTPTTKEGTAAYATGSIGLLLKPSVSYLIGRHVALDLGLYYTNQMFKSTENTYRITDKAGSYSSMTNGVKSANASSLGLNLGLRIYLGKPKDRDHDGIPDRTDLCPDDSGIALFHGCPDTDGDGIPDKEDLCPTVKGLAQFHGCPDSDGDGIPDKEDECPYQAGIAQFKGCPDTDGDGIPDKEDHCPTVKGLAQYHGCPDTDGDGVPDNEDKCPTVAGPVSNQGCPEEPKPAPVVEEKIDIATEVLFDVDKITIKKSSYPGLEGVVKKLHDNPDAYVQIDGYTDNTGSKAYNKKLSLKRASVVKQYLLKHGASAKQLKARGHGSKTPAASNKTKEGRAQNRRAEIKIQSGK